jgi:hypothetical protein
MIMKYQTAEVLLQLGCGCSAKSDNLAILTLNLTLAGLPGPLPGRCRAGEIPSDLQKFCEPPYGIEP